MAFKKVASNLEALTPELARQFANMRKVEGERKLKAKRLRFFKDHLANGTFIDPTWSKGLCKEDGQEYRLDGQHASTVLADIPADKFPDLMVTIEVYEFDSIGGDKSLLFDKFDNPDSVRDDLDKLHNDTAQHQDLLDLDQRLLDRAARAILFHQKELVKDGMVLTARRKGLYFESEKNRRFGRWLSQFQGTTHSWLLFKNSVIAEAYVDYLYHEEMATEFWTWVFRESHDDETHETRELTRTLRDWAHAIKKRPPIQFHKRTKQAWDRFRRVRELEPPPSDKATVPVEESTTSFV